MSDDQERVVIPTEEEVAQYGTPPDGAATEKPPAGAEAGAGAAQTAATPDEARPTENEWKELALRARADLSNYQKRAEKDRAEVLRYANSNLLKALLSVLDNLERVVQTGSGAEGKLDALVSGAKLTLELFQKVLRDYHVEPIAAEGRPFDPTVHEAMMERPSEHPEPIVLQEVGKGYKLHERVLRPAKVIVSKPAAAAEANKGMTHDEA